MFTLTAEADRVLRQLAMFLSLDVQNEMHLTSRVFCYSWLVCLFVCINNKTAKRKATWGLLGLWPGNVSLVIVGNPISDGTVFVFYLAWCGDFRDLELKKNVQRTVEFSVFHGAGFDGILGNDKGVGVPVFTNRKIKTTKKWNTPEWP